MICLPKVVIPCRIVQRNYAPSWGYHEAEYELLATSTMIALKSANELDFNARYSMWMLVHQNQKVLMFLQFCILSHVKNTYLHLRSSHFARFLHKLFIPPWNKHLVIGLLPIRFWKFIFLFNFVDTQHTFSLYWWGNME